MAEENKFESQEKGFVVRDKRFSARKETEKEVEAKTQAREGERVEEPPKKEKEEGPLPEITFINFIFSLSTSALIQLGEIQDPMTQKIAKNLPLAKQTIDLIGMLKDKTKGNLTPDEEKVLDNVLFDLRMRYVKAVS